MTTKPPLQKILQGILYTDESKKNQDRTGSIKTQEKKRQIIKSSTDLIAHNQILKQQKQMNHQTYRY
jgi:hypothetical protein